MFVEATGCKNVSRKVENGDTAAERQRSAARDRWLTIPADGIAGPLHRVVIA